MKYPTHSIQHVRKKFKICLLIAAFFAALTVAAAVAAVLAGFQIARLHSSQKDGAPPLASESTNGIP